MRKKRNKEKKTNKTYLKKYRKTRKNKRLSFGGSTIYNDGTITKSVKTYNGKEFFRKVFYYSHPPTDEEIKNVFAETKIAKILMKNPHPNIVNYFTIKIVEDKPIYIDMEELDITNNNINEVKEVMENVKTFLQNLGIMYIDWKIENIGRDKDGNYKLFDFDASGIIDDVNRNKWIVKPNTSYVSYQTAIMNGFTEPKQIDDWSFEYNILRTKTNRISYI